MNTLKVLVIDETPQTLQMIEDTLTEANARYQVCSSTEDAWKCFQADPDMSCVLIRLSSESIDGRELTRRIRSMTSDASIQVVMIVTEDQIELAGSAIDAGASDIIIEPFEPRELRMRMGVKPELRRNRIDQPHPIAVAEEKPAAESVNYRESVRPSQSHSSVVSPKFDPLSLRFTYDATESQIAGWKEDPSVTKIALDKILVCPHCEGVPTFRLGCGCCGSAMTEADTLIHHYACAHIATEADFRKGDDLVCPKCRQKNLVAGSDFEAVAGGLACADCGVQSSQLELIGHCLCCQHRFPAAEATSRVLTAFHVHRVHETTDRHSHLKPAEKRSVRESAVT